MTVLLRFSLPVLAALIVSACVTHGDESIEAEALVDKARWTIRHFDSREDKASRAFRRDFARARGVVIFPSVVKGGFIIGAEGGSGVMLARNEATGWSYPAFYTMGAGSFGLQIGGSASQLVMLLMSDEAIAAVIEDQGKFGGDLQITAGTFGAGIEGSTTSNVGGDIIAYAYGEGVFFGASLEGAVMGRRNDLNEAYYQTAAGPHEIVIENRHWNKQANALREALAAIGVPLPTATVPTEPAPAS